MSLKNYLRNSTLKFGGLVELKITYWYLLGLVYMLFIPLKEHPIKEHHTYFTMSVETLLFELTSLSSSLMGYLI